MAEEKRKSLDAVITQANGQKLQRLADVNQKLSDTNKCQIAQYLSYFSGNAKLFAHVS
jgi:hypothetical protein